MISSERETNAELFKQRIINRFKGIKRIVAYNDEKSEGDFLGFDHSQVSLMLRIRWDSTGIACFVNPGYIKPLPETNLPAV